MQEKKTDRIRLRYIGLAGLIGAVLFLVLAAGSLIRSSKAAQEAMANGTIENASGAPSGEATEEGAVTAAEGATVDGAAATDAAAGTVTTDTTAGTTADGTATGTATADGTANGTTSAAGTTGGSAPVTVKISAAGDFTLGNDDTLDYDTSFNYYYDEVAGYPGYFLENIKSIFEDDDLTIVNFEGTLTDGGERADKEYAFKGRPEFVQVLTEGSVEACNVANNHAFDYGEEAYQETKQHLTDAGITVFGYDNSKVVEVNGIKVGLIGYMELYEGLGCLEKVNTEIEKVREQGAQLIIVTYHWGDEGAYHHYEDQETLGHAAIDAGADLVIGHHSHRIQEMEEYKGKYIFYSLANCCFGGHPNPSDMDSFIMQQTFTFIDGKLQPKKDEDVRIIPYRISSTSEYNNYQPTPYDRDEDGFNRVIEKVKGTWFTESD